MRIQTLLISALLLVAGCSDQPSSKLPVQANDGINVGDPGSNGFDTGVISRMEAEIGRGIYPNIHSLIIMRNGLLVYEKYWPGKDEVWGNPVGDVDHDMNTLHDLRSVSKSVVAICTARPGSVCAEPADGGATGNGLEIQWRHHAAAGINH